MYNIQNFSATDAVKCGREIRNLGTKARSMEEAANEIVRFFHDHFVEESTGARSFALVRLFKTHDYDRLGDELQAFARNLAGGTRLPPNCKCFTLLGTCGVNPEWESRRKSKGHQAIPLPSTRAVEQIPMMRNLIKQMGLEISAVVAPDPKLVLDLSQRTFNVFHVANAEGSAYVPTQEEFVKPYQVKSVMGFGGVLPSGNVFVVIVFSRTPIPRESADRFAPLALNAKMVVLPFERKVFA